MKEKFKATKSDHKKSSKSRRGKTSRKPSSATRKARAASAKSPKFKYVCAACGSQATKPPCRKGSRFLDPLNFNKQSLGTWHCTGKCKGKVKVRRMKLLSQRKQRQRPNQAVKREKRCRRVKTADDLEIVRCPVCGGKSSRCKRCNGTGEVAVVRQKYYLEECR